MNKCPDCSGSTFRIVSGTLVDCPTCSNPCVSEIIAAVKKCRVAGPQPTMIYWEPCEHYDGPPVKYVDGDRSESVRINFVTRPKLPGPTIDPGKE